LRNAEDAVVVVAVVLAIVKVVVTVEETEGDVVADKVAVDVEVNMLIMAKLSSVLKISPFLADQEVFHHPLPQSSLQLYPQPLPPL